MWALADCNSFFYSVEKAFHPGLEGKSVCVLSSNDGNIVALTPEEKALGLRRGDPVFKVRDITNRNNVKLFSTNRMLYAAMSRRVTNILRKNIHYVENYGYKLRFKQCLFLTLPLFLRQLYSRLNNFISSFRK